jgi:hypothetical protein
MLTIEDFREKFEVNQPIFVSDVDEKFDLSKTTIRKSLSILAQSSGELRRFSKGIYYLSEPTIVGPTLLNPYQVIERKYLGTKDNPVGVYAGMTNLNRLELSTQIPNTIELITNNQKSYKRLITVRRQNVIVRRSKVTVNKENAKLLEVIEAVSFYSDYKSKIEKARVERLAELIKENDFTRKELDVLLIKYPKRVYKKFIESRLINEFN